MTSEDRSKSTFDEIAHELASARAGVKQSKMMGMPCLKIEGKMFAGYFEGNMTFKLSGGAHARALALPGARLFDPSEQGRPMKEWVQVPDDLADEWRGLAEEALRYVRPAGRE
jgi:hypothetical protein